MKTLTRTLKPFALVVAVLIASFTVVAQQPKGYVVIPARVEIHPCIKLSEADQKALDDLLAKPEYKDHQDLYRIETYDNGKLMKTQGTLSREHLEKSLSDELKSKKTKSFSTITDQAYNSPGSKDRVEHEFVKEFGEILKNYQKDYDKKH